MDADCALFYAEYSIKENDVSAPKANTGANANADADADAAADANADAHADAYAHADDDAYANADANADADADNEEMHSGGSIKKQSQNGMNEFGYCG